MDNYITGKLIKKLRINDATRTSWKDLCKWQRYF